MKTNKSKTIKIKHIDLQTKFSNYSRSTIPTIINFNFNKLVHAYSSISNIEEYFLVDAGRSKSRTEQTVLFHKLGSE